MTPMPVRILIQLKQHYIFKTNPISVIDLVPTSEQGFITLAIENISILSRVYPFHICYLRIFI